MEQGLPFWMSDDTDFPIEEIQSRWGAKSKFSQYKIVATDKIVFVDMCKSPLLQSPSCMRSVSQLKMLYMKFGPSKMSANFDLGEPSSNDKNVKFC